MVQARMAAVSWPRVSVGMPTSNGARTVTSQRISVVICAYTEARWDQTRAAVDSVRAQSVPAEEIIVVVDRNPALCARLAAALPGVRVVESSGAPGVSAAKNTGVALARGDVVAFLDDDAVAEPDWLGCFADSLADPRVIGVGGLVRPRWEDRRPRWFPAEFDWVVGCNDLRAPRSGAPVRNLMGGNMSLRREAFELAGEFRSDVGRSAGKSPLGCEDTEFCIRLSRQSPASVLLFDGRAVIWHRVPAARCRFSYFVSRCFGEGLSKAAVTALVGAGRGLSAERYYAVRILPRGMVRGVIDLLGGDAGGLDRAGAIVTGLVVTAAGYAAGWLRGMAGRNTPGPGPARRHDRGGWRERPRAPAPVLTVTGAAGADSPSSAH